MTEKFFITDGIDNSNIGEVTLEQAVASFLDYKKSDFFGGVKPTTYQRLAMTSKSILRYFDGGRMLLLDITEQDLRRFISEIARSNSYSTVKKNYEFFHALYRYLFYVRRIELFATNPSTFLELPKQKTRKKVETMNSQECHQFYKTCLERNQKGELRHRYGAALIFLLNTGLRAGELCALAPDDVHIAQSLNEGSAISCVSVNKTVISIPVTNKDGSTDWKNVIQDTPKSSASVRTVPLNSTAVEMAEIMKEQFVRNQYAETLICTSSGRPVSVSNLTKYMKNILDEAQIQKSGGCHMLRDTFATMLLESGIELSIISKTLGHSNPNVTYNHYINITQELLARELRTVELK